jgi:hypothetical protein
MPLRSWEQARQQLWSFCSHQVLHSLMGRTQNIFGYLEAPLSYASNESRTKSIGGSYKRIWPNHRWLHVLKFLDSKQSWSETAITPSYELRLRWMSTHWKCNFIIFSMESYFGLCSVMYTGENQRGRGSSNMMRIREWRWGRQQRRDVWVMLPLDHTWRNSEAWNKTNTPGALANEDTWWRHPMRRVVWSKPRRISHKGQYSMT